MNPLPRKQAIRGHLAFLLGCLGAGASIASIYATPVEGAAALGCGVDALSCDTALTSRFSAVAGIPLGVFGLFYFSFWTLNLRAFLRTGEGIYRTMLSWVTMTGAVVSITLGSIMFLVLRAPCLYCLLTHLANLGSLALLWPALRWRPNFRFGGDHFWHFLSLSAISLLAATALFFANKAHVLEAQLDRASRTLW